ncbi:hypothetical protein G7070_02205 [Propioniciclava coleopterorum]|uniref:Esterase n=1 Tax=Propioniciclava coleopterorum TaxID=2714937 RepID=A0A6G7Y3C8_9ACTN|nr:hypothetical protein [Propioniciclava coleopterorum]QIK71312.1 hypothetical protein G7070_02205 [Propioniciclava coleopterorum]
MARRRRHVPVLFGAVALTMVAAIGFTWWRPWQLFTGGGGTFADRTNQTFTASNGLSSTYHLYAAGLTHETAIGIVFQFHGDGAYEFTHPTSSYSFGGSAGIVAEARSRGYIVVPVLSPDRSGETTWWEEGERNATFADELIATMRERYPGAADNTWLVGYSGGSQFITQFYLPLHARTLTGGGAVMFAGGGRPYDVASRAFPDALKPRFPMHWYTGARDDGRRSDDGYDALGDEVHGAKAGVAYYSAAGFPTTYEWVPGLGHDLDDRFGGVLAQQLDLHAR